jgi:hypothetical protein
VNSTEIEQIIRANIDKTVRVSYSDGTGQTLIVHTVDDEGFVCDIASEMSRPPRFAYWVRFADVHEVLPVAQEFRLENPSFTVEFLEHLSPQDWQQWLIQLGNTGASVEPQSERVYVVVCSRPQQLAHVGWLLFHSHLRNLCRVVSTSGGAEARASAYPKPSSV